MGETAFQVALSVTAWCSLGILFAGFVIGAALMPSSYRLGLGILFLATFSGFVFSFLTGFSIGRFTVVLPLVVTAFAVTYGRPRRLQFVAHAAAIIIYLVLAWLIVGISWGIPIELPLCFLAYAVAFLLPAPTRSSLATGQAG